MRGRLLANPAALADYEIVEMLLFLGIPRRDTKPQAKGLIQRFGGLSPVLQATEAMLVDAGLPRVAAAAFAVVREASAHMARVRPRVRPRLSDWLALEDYLDPPARAEEGPGVSVLLLDSRNQLLLEHRWPAQLDWPAMQQDLLRQALDRYAGAVLVVRNAGSVPAKLLDEDRARHAGLTQAAGALSIVVHDWLVLGGGDWVSLRKAGNRR